MPQGADAPQRRGVRRRRYLSASEAASLLGVSRASLYSYVSRGRIRAERDTREPRTSRYLAADVERLRSMKEARRHPDVAARQALSLGLPVLESSITLIENGRLYYRGRDAIALARRATFEDAVRLLWNVDRSRVPAVLVSRRCREAIEDLRALPAMERIQAVLPIAAADDASSFDTSPDAVAAAGWRILATMTAAITRRTDKTDTPLAAQLARGWRARTPVARRLIDLALILCADHELNVSAFAVHVAASTGTSPYDAVAAGLAALRGPRHGGFTEEIERFLEGAGRSTGVMPAMRERLRREEAIPGFGHPLYPDGDPRARVLFTEVAAQWPEDPSTMLALAARRAGRLLLGDAPTLDYGLVVLRRALGLPRGSALLLFALGRTAGWIAHAMEQYATGQLIRPRASYVGPLPAGPKGPALRRP
jgi:citrate synthase